MQESYICKKKKHTLMELELSFGGGETDGAHGQLGRIIHQLGLAPPLPSGLPPTPDSKGAAASAARGLTRITCVALSNAIGATGEGGSAEIWISGTGGL